MRENEKRAGPKAPPAFHVYHANYVTLLSSPLHPLAKSPIGVLYLLS